MKAGGDKTVATIKERICDIQRTDKQKGQCRDNIQVYHDLACRTALKPFKQACEEVVVDTLMALNGACVADPENDNKRKKAQCLYLNLDESYGNARKKFVVGRLGAESLFASEHLTQIKPALFAQAQPGEVFTAVEKALTDPGAIVNLTSLVQLCNKATGKEEAAKKILAAALTTLSSDIPALTLALKSMTAPFDAVKKQIEQLMEVVSFSNPVATENAGVLKELCGQPIIGDPENEECKLSVQRGQKQIATQAGPQAEAVYTDPSSSLVPLRLKLKVDDPKNQDGDNAIEKPKATLEEFQQAAVMEYGHAPRFKLRIGHIFAPDGGFGEPKDGQNFQYDDLNGKLLSGYPFLNFSAGVTFGHTIDSFSMLSLEYAWARGRPVQDANNAEGEIDTGDHNIFALSYSSHRFFAKDWDWYWKGALRLHYVPDEPGIPRGPNLGPGGVSQPGLHAAAGVERYVSRRVSIFAELGASWSCSRDNLLSDDDRAADPNLVDREIFNCYRTQDGTAVVPSLMVGAGF